MKQMFTARVGTPTLSPSLKPIGSLGRELGVEPEQFVFFLTKPFDPVKGVTYRLGDKPGTEVALRQAIAAGLPDRRYRRDYRDRYYALDENGNTVYSDSVVLGRERVEEIVAWEVIEIQTRRGGAMRLVTNTCRIDN